MADLKDLREAAGEAEKALKWTRVAISVEEQIRTLSARIESLKRQREHAKDPKAQAGYDMALSQSSETRGELERKKSDALSKIRKSAHEVLGKTS